MTDDQVQDAVNIWLERITQTNVIRGWQGGTRPSAPYIMSNMTGTAEVRVHEQETIYERNEEGPGTLATPVIETEWRFSLHAYGSSPTDILRPIRTAVKLNQIEENLRPGLLVFDISQIRHIPEFQNERWEDRAQMDMNVRGLVKDGMIIDTIEHFSFEWLRA